VNKAEGGKVKKDHDWVERMKRLEEIEAARSQPSHPPGSTTKDVIERL
jgi:hypothetical protein